MAPRVLVVDDDAAIRRFVEHALKEFGYAVTVAEGGAEALQHAETDGAFDLLLTDVMMPRMRGDEVAAAMRKTQPWLKVVYLTGFTNALFATHPTLAEHETVVEKPVTLAQLHDAVSLAIYGHRGGPS
jgi:two-component system cell cycle sensor histidine kinase/response regulator CckA